jgi:hypothetical protein
VLNSNSEVGAGLPRVSKLRAGLARVSKLRGGVSAWSFAACLIAVFAGCASETDAEIATTGGARASSVSEALELATPERGFQVETSGAVIEPGDDVRMCEVVVLPGETSERFAVNRVESALSSRGEDLIVRAADPGSDTAALMDRGESMPCTRAGEAFGEELNDVLLSTGGYSDERYPSGAGKVFSGGQKLAVEYHSVNADKDALVTKAKLSFHVVDADAIQHLARNASFENFTIYTPPNGHSSHLGECRVHQDMTVSDLARRTQHYGTGFKVWLAGGEHDGQLVWDSADRRDSRTTLASPLHLAAGEGLRFQCDYENPTDHELRYGVSAADETCALDATFVSADDDSAVSEDCLLFNVDADGVARPRS